MRPIEVFWGLLKPWSPAMPKLSNADLSHIAEIIELVQRSILSKDELMEPYLRAFDIPMSPDLLAKIRSDFENLRQRVLAQIPARARGRPALWPFQLDALFILLEDRAAKTSEPITSLVTEQALQYGLNPNSHKVRYFRWKKSKSR